MEIVKNIAKNSLEIGKMYVYHREQNNVARKILKVIESEKGILDPKRQKIV
ncbi:hypothetical protein [Gelidibacter algens]|uniref:hypothetical protein n=1 Tax=Gelidibacter algens TaxID=49280 RepID=UPI0012F99B1C|nr:hypothetical protein [Gelidibacter algens]